MKNVLTPLSVPWEIINGDGLSSFTFEFSDNGYPTLKFSGNILINTQNYPNQRFSGGYRLPAHLGDMCQYNHDLCIVGAVITATFHHFINVKIAPAPSKEDMITIFEFDQTKIPPMFQLARVNFDQKKFFEEEHPQTLCTWLTDGVCPMPHAFEVLDSAWLKDHPMIHGLKFQRNLHHYLFVGDESLIEVLAEDYEWQAELWFTEMEE